MDVCFTAGMWLLHLALRPTPYRVKTVLTVSKPMMLDRITLAEFQRVCFFKGHHRLHYSFWESTGEPHLPEGGGQRERGGNRRSKPFSAVGSAKMELRGTLSGENVISLCCAPLLFARQRREAAPAMNHINLCQDKSFLCGSGFFGLT